ncbi:hypothetical protein SCARR_00916 [Pontiella sulfatireligans]|uniref:alpha-L-fucosidase n=2 Tax=Pontiella sulfatireligans TaxID=2750658 RepID=A0A6C2UG68_9BACT|nr:hypothetical protein SCARR_00916 [Pontiella sulfatireligans]
MRIMKQGTGLVMGVGLLLLCGAAVSANTTNYEPTWESLGNYEAPEWYEDAKLGFWVHWGVYSVPAFKGDHAAEWYGRRMYQKDGQSQFNRAYAQHRHHLDKYGDPAEFGYKDFIPMFKAENFDADLWADLCIRGGAKFFTMMGVHHDSFCLWDTKLSKWNSVNMGPKRDLVNEMAKAVRKRGLKFGVSNHSAWNYMFFQWNHINQYDAKNPANQDLYGNPVYPKELAEARFREGETRGEWFERARNTVTPSQRDLDRWLARTKELADMYQPDLYYFDWGMNPPAFESRRKEFAAHYYNNAIRFGQGAFGSPNVVLNYKNGSTFKPGSAVRDFERGGMDQIAGMAWQTDDCVYDDHNWGYVPDTPIKPTNQIVDQLMDIISKRGVLMLSFAPKPDGTFPEEQKTMMYELGDWLEACGEAVYSTRPYVVHGVVGEQWGKRNEHGVKLYESTIEDVRFTRNKANSVLYATMLKWPGEKLVLETFKGVDLSGVKFVSLLGTDGELLWEQTEAGLEIQLTKEPSYGMAYPIRIEFETRIPAPAKTMPRGERK